jgi:SAM-dependent methyltransferase
MKDSKVRFSETVENYEKYRPSYPGALVDWILEPFRGLPPRILDLGCGTGITARLFAPRSKSIVGVDPNEEMLERARAKGLERGEYKRGESTNTGLEAGSIDLVIAGQAFHWFDLEPTFAELARVLVPGGWCAAFWNLRAESPFLEAYEALLVSASKEYRELSSAPDTHERLRVSPFLGEVRAGTFPNLQRFDREGLFGRAYSSSYVVHGIEDHAEFDRRLGEIFDRFAENGGVEFVYRCVAVMGRVRSRP